MATVSKQEQKDKHIMNYNNIFKLFDSRQRRSSDPQIIETRKRRDSSFRLLKTSASCLSFDNIKDIRQHISQLARKKAPVASQLRRSSMTKTMRTSEICSDAIAHLREDDSTIHDIDEEEENEHIAEQYEELTLQPEKFMKTDTNGLPRLFQGGEFKAVNGWISLNREKENLEIEHEENPFLTKHLTRLQGNFKSLIEESQYIRQIDRKIQDEKYGNTLESTFKLMNSRATI